MEYEKQAKLQPFKSSFASLLSTIFLYGFSGKKKFDLIQSSLKHYMFELSYKVVWWLFEQKPQTYATVYLYICIPLPLISSVASTCTAKCAGYTFEYV